MRARRAAGMSTRCGSLLPCTRACGPAQAGRHTRGNAGAVQAHEPHLREGSLAEGLVQAGRHTRGNAGPVRTPMRMQVLCGQGPHEPHLREGSLRDGAVQHMSHTCGKAVSEMVLCST